jgi:hypothetical protein
MRAAFAVILAIPLTGCLTVTTEETRAAKKAELAAKDDETCRSYGAKPGTDIYVQCRMAQVQGREAAENAAMSGTTVVTNSPVSTTAGDPPTLTNILPSRR